MDLELLLAHLKGVFRRGTWVNLLPPIGILCWVGSEVAAGDARWTLLPWALLAIGGLAMMVSNSVLVTNPRDPGAGDPEDDVTSSRSVRVLCVFLSVAAVGAALLLVAAGEGGFAGFVAACAVLLLLLFVTGVDESRAEVPGSVAEVMDGVNDDRRALAVGEGAFQDIPIRSPAEPDPVRGPAAS